MYPIWELNDNTIFVGLGKFSFEDKGDNCMVQLPMAMGNDIG
jgi:hypothetical protein